MKLLFVSLFSIFSQSIAQQCQIETCDDLESTLEDAESQVSVLLDENQDAQQKQKMLKDKLRPLNVCKPAI